MIDFRAVLTDLENQPVKEQIAGHGPDFKPQLVELTLGRACSHALLMPVADEGKISGADHVKRLALALKVHAAGELDITVEEIALLKDRVAKVYATLVVGRCWLLLDPASAG
jgi:hypothetical protein